MNCPIWNTPAALLEGGGDFKVVKSPRAGGPYWISGTGEGTLGSSNELRRKLLTSWLCQQRHAGIEVPRITSDVVEAMITRQPKSVMRRATDALLFMGRKSKNVGTMLSMGSADDEDTLECMAETESTNERDLFHLYKLLESQGLISGSFYISGGFHAQLTFSGWAEIERLTESKTIDSTQAFVAMWFSKETEDAFAEAIAPAIRASGYKPLRIDQKEHNNKIDDEIIAEIRRSRFLVADFSCEKDKPRGGVYFEAGFAMGLGIPVIWTCRTASLEDVHFDTRQYAHILWASPSDLLEKLKNRIGATIGSGPLVNNL